MFRAKSLNRQALIKLFLVLGFLIVAVLGTTACDELEGTAVVEENVMGVEAPDEGEEGVQPELQVDTPEPTPTETDTPEPTPTEVVTEEAVVETTEPTVEAVVTEEATEEMAVETAEPTVEEMVTEEATAEMMVETAEPTVEQTATEEATAEMMVETAEPTVEQTATEEATAEMMVEETPEATVEATMEATDVTTPSVEADTALEEQPVEPGEQQMPASEPAVRAEMLLDYNVMNSAGEEIAELQDLLMGLDSGQVTYALFSFGELFDLEEPLYLIPLNKFSLDPQQQQITLDVTQEILEAAPGFADEDALPDFSQQDWDVENRAFWVDTDIGPDVEPIGQDVTVEGTLEATAEPTLEGLEGGPEEEPTVEATEEAMMATPTVTAAVEMTGTAALTPTAAVTTTGEQVVRASELLEYEVINRNDEELGEVEDVLIGLDSNKVNYVVLATGGFLGLGEELFAIPFDAYTIDPQEETALLDVAEDNLANAPGFEVDAWPDFTTPGWDVETRGFWAGRVATVAPRAGVLGRTIDEPGWRVSNLLGAEIQTLQGETLGTIQNMTVSRDDGVVSYAMVSTGETAEALSPVPFYAITLDPDNLTSNLDPQVIADAPPLQPDAWPDLTSPDWDEEIRNYWLETDVGVTPAPAAIGADVIATGEPAFRATELLGADVNLAESENTGTLEEMIIGATSRQATYAIITSPGQDETLFPVPFPAMTFDVSDGPVTLTLDVSPEALENSPGFEADTWPDLADPRWDVPYFNYWMATVSQVGISTIRATSVLDYDLVNLQGEAWGELEDLIVGLDSGHIYYALVAFDGFLDFGEELVPLPIGAMEPDAQRLRMVLDLDMTEETLQEAPTFDPEERPDLLDQGWTETYDTFWGEFVAEAASPEGTTRPAEPESGIILSDLLEYDVQNEQGDELGDMEDLILDFNNNQVDYALLSFGGFLDIGDEEVPVPLGLFSLQAENNLLLLNADQQTLEDAPRFEGDLWTDPASEALESEIADYWQTQ